jgi:hypothetical protein
VLPFPELLIGATVDAPGVGSLGGTTIRARLPPPRLPALRVGRHLAGEGVLSSRVMPAQALVRDHGPDDVTAKLHQLVTAHRKRADEPLELAVQFVPKRGRKSDLYLFEVLSGFGGDEPDRNRKLLNVSFGSTPGLRLPTGIELHLILTSPEELEKALLDGWPSLRPVLDAKRDGNANVLFKSGVGARLWRKMK